ncbi:DUF2628 domain-containing protein [Enterobacter sp. E76]|nr:DUF2628 domain-containing protein [Enterobacter sp. E76]
MSSNYIEDGSLSEKWKYRFSFYDRYGFPGFWSVKPEYKKAIKELTFRQKATIGMNFYAFFFSFIYLFILGLWKKAILVFFLAFAVQIIAAIVGYNFLGFVVSIYVAQRTNKWFYEKEVKSFQTWSL